MGPSVFVVTYRDRSVAGGQEGATPSARAAGPDEIVLSAPAGQPCSDRAHHNQGRAAAVVVSFGQLGTPGQDYLWRECWGRSYPMCRACWDRTRATAHMYRPGLTVTDLSGT